MGIALALVMVILPVASAVQEADKKHDPSKTEIKVTGCAKGSTLTETNLRVPGSDDKTPLRRWRLRGPKSLMNQIKEHEGRELEIAGTTKSGESMAVAGRRIGKTNIFIGGDTNRTTMRDPLPEVPTIDVEAFETTGEPCR